MKKFKLRYFNALFDPCLRFGTLRVLFFCEWCSIQKARFKAYLGLFRNFQCLWFRCWQQWWHSFLTTALDIDREHLKRLDWWRPPRWRFDGTEVCRSAFPPLWSFSDGFLTVASWWGRCQEFRGLSLRGSRRGSTGPPGYRWWACFPSPARLFGVVD